MLLVGLCGATLIAFRAVESFSFGIRDLRKAPLLETWKKEEQTSSFALVCSSWFHIINQIQKRASNSPCLRFMYRTWTR